MNIQIKGKIIKDNGEWLLKISILEEPLRCSRPLRCFKELEQILRIELEDEKLECFFRITDGGVFYLLTAQTTKMIEFLAEKLTDLSDLKIDTALDD